MQNVLNKTFGLKSFKPGQKEIIQSVTDGKDVFVVMPTGSGKSLCYQLPAILSEGCTLVISPLIALMQVTGPIPQKTWYKLRRSNLK